MNRAVVVAIAAIFLSGAAVRSEPTEAMTRMGDVDQIPTISRGSTVHSLRDPGHAASQQCCKICRPGRRVGIPVSCARTRAMSDRGAPATADYRKGQWRCDAGNGRQ